MTRARMQGRAQAATAALALVLAAALLLTGAIAGFFYAYSARPGRSCRRGSP